jgi:hypothetical protein
MNVPGFTAESSIHQTSGHYRVRAGSFSGLADGRLVSPQLPRQISLLNCLDGCDNMVDANARIACTNRCSLDDFLNQVGSKGGGAKGGSGGAGGQLHCGPCRHGVQHCFVLGLGGALVDCDGTTP